MNGSRMKDMKWIKNIKKARSKFQGVNPEEIEDRNEEKGEFSAASEIKKKIVK